MNEENIKNVIKAIENFIKWLNNFGELSYDHQSYFASPLGGRAKALYYKSPILGTLAVSPMIVSEAFLPAARCLFWKKQRLPIADAHYAMGFSYLYQVLNTEDYYNKAVHFLNILLQTRCQDYDNYCWGYPFNWETRNGTIPIGTPLITTTPYAYEAFWEVYKIDNNEKWLEVIHSIVQHVVNDIKDFKISTNAKTCSYSPLKNDFGGIVNASAYRAFLLTSASILLNSNSYWKIAEQNLNFVLQAQQENGSWFYAIDNKRDFVDHFHTCFVLKALAKIERLTGHEGCNLAINKGVEFYVQNLFTEEGYPKPFSIAPRLTVYKQELYDYAECINLGILLNDRFDSLHVVFNKTLEDLFMRWQRRDGSFRSRKLIFGWDNVPMHRWAQAQIFRSLSYLVFTHKQKNQLQRI